RARRKPPAIRMPGIAGSKKLNGWCIGQRRHWICRQSPHCWNSSTAPIPSSCISTAGCPRPSACSLCRTTGPNPHCKPCRRDANNPKINGIESARHSAYTATMRTLETLNIDNQFARLDEAFYTRLAPSPLHDVRLVASNPEAATLLDLDPAQLQRPEFLDMFSGRKPHPQFEPLAMVYSGHQFGVYNPQLGDGRGILLGEVLNAQGEYWDIHLKGAGKTPYSRFGDGRAVLRSCVREYLGSEALHYLGIPTSRALCIFGSREPVQRETIEQGAALIRLSPSHVRFGSFEFFFYNRMEDQLQALADFVINKHYPDFRQAENPYTELFRAADTSTARMIAQWQAVGFAHGVMNIDNMSILGITFDYGPFGFMDDFVPGYICNHSDHQGRYAFHQQPGIALWNLNA